MGKGDGPVLEIDRDLPGNRDVFPNVPAGEEGEEKEEGKEGETDEQGYKMRQVHDHSVLWQ